MLEKEARRERERESSCHSNYVIGERGKEERVVVFEVGIFLTFGHPGKKMGELGGVPDIPNRDGNGVGKAEVWDLYLAPYGFVLSYSTPQNSTLHQFIPLTIVSIFLFLIKFVSLI